MKRGCVWLSARRAAPLTLFSQNLSQKMTRKNGKKIALFQGKFKSAEPPRGWHVRGLAAGPRRATRRAETQSTPTVRSAPTHFRIRITFSNKKSLE